MKILKIKEMGKKIIIKIHQKRVFARVKRKIVRKKKKYLSIQKKYQKILEGKIRVLMNVFKMKMLMKISYTVKGNPKIKVLINKEIKDKINCNEENDDILGSNNYPFFKKEYNKTQYIEKEKSKIIYYIIKKFIFF